MITQLRTINTKNARKSGKMGVIHLEDFKGKVEALVFGDEYERYQPLLTPDAIIFLRGTVDRRREEPSIRVDEVIPAAQATAALTESIILTIPSGPRGEELLDPVIELLKAHARGRGTKGVYLDVQTGEPFVATISCGPDLRVPCSAAFLDAARALLGDDAVSLITAAGRRLPLEHALVTS
jgi:DNA polymerase-3 subunit alpha